MSHPIGALLCLLLASSSLLARPAQAYPQWQFVTGAARCNQCHYAPAGGGLLSGYGREAAGQDLSMRKSDGSFLFGAVPLPSWLALGGDFRVAFVSQAVHDFDGSHQAIFPMQADLQVRIALPAGLSFSASVGFRGQVRSQDDIVPLQNYQPISTSRFISREHQLMWQPSKLGPYLRIGRFYAPFGLRLAEHVTYVRRDLGFNLMEETYNVSGGYLDDEWEVHLTMFAPDFLLQIGSRESGAAAYGEKRLLDDSAAVALQGRLGVGGGITRLTAGAVGKIYLAPMHTLFLGEGNLVHQGFAGDGIGEHLQFVGAAGFAFFPVRGLILTLLGERNQEDLKVAGAVWNALDGFINWFPYPHCEVEIMGRWQTSPGGEGATTFLGQLHYFL